MVFLNPPVIHKVTHKGMFMGWFNRSRLASDVEVVALLRTLNVKLGQLEGEIEKLKSGHQTLRGFVYAKLRKADASPPDDGPAPSAAGTGSALPASMTKAELRRQLTQTGRIMPGRPTHHD